MKSSTSNPPASLLCPTNEARRRLQVRDLPRDLLPNLVRPKLDFELEPVPAPLHPMHAGIERTPIQLRGPRRRKLVVPRPSRIPERQPRRRFSERVCIGAHSASGGESKGGAVVHRAGLERRRRRLVRRGGELRGRGSVAGLGADFGAVTWSLVVAARTSRTRSARDGEGGTGVVDARAPRGRTEVAWDGRSCRPYRLGVMMAGGGAVGGLVGVGRGGETAVGGGGGRGGGGGSRVIVVGNGLMPTCVEVNWRSRTKLDVWGTEARPESAPHHRPRGAGLTLRIVGDTLLVNHHVPPRDIVAVPPVPLLRLSQGGLQARSQVVMPRRSLRSSIPRPVRPRIIPIRLPVPRHSTRQHVPAAVALFFA